MKNESSEPVRLSKKPMEVDQPHTSARLMKLQKVQGWNRSQMEADREK